MLPIRLATLILLMAAVVARGAGAEAAPGNAAAADGAADEAAAKIVRNELAVAALLKSGIFPAEIQFQGGGYRDTDGNNIGEYGFLDELSGRRGTPKVQAGLLKLLQGPLATGDVAEGYRFAVFLPNGTGGAVDAAGDTQAIAQTATRQRERFFIAYAWPESPEDGDTVFALAQDGQVRAERWTGRPAMWRDAFAPGARFGGELAWPLFEKTPEMLRIEQEQHAGERERRYLQQIGEMAGAVRVLGGLWPIDCSAIQRLAAQQLQGGVQAAHPPRLPPFAYVRPRDTVDAKRPILVSDPQRTHDHVALVVFLDLPAADATDIRPRVGLLRLEGDAAARVFATAQAVAAAPATRSDGADADAWAPVRDALDAAGADAVTWGR